MKRKQTEEELQRQNLRSQLLADVSLKIIVKLFTTMKNPQLASYPQSKIKLLIAEDNLVNQKVLLKQLQNLGYDADVVANGEEVLNLLDKIPYDLILMDCQMPILDGLETTREIRRRQPSSFASRQQPVVIAITANAMKEDEQSCLDAGMDDYLSKPVVKNKLAEMLECWSRVILTPQEVTISDQTMGLPDSNTSYLDVPIDWQHLHQLSENNSQFEFELLAIYIENVQENLEIFKTAIASQDFQQIAKLSHHLKGSSGNLGATTMYQVAEKLEQMSRQQQLAGADKLVEELEDILTQIQAVVINHQPSL